MAANFQESEPDSVPSTVASATRPSVVSRTEGHAIRAWGWRATLILCGLGLLAFAGDFLVYRIKIFQSYPLVCRALFPTIEAFGQGLGVVLIGCVIYLVDRSHRPRVAWLVVCAVAAGIACNVIKPTAFRLRPREARTVCHATLDTFYGPQKWLLSPQPQLVFNRRYHSFPSGHTASAAALATALAWFYPRGRYGFALLTVMVALQRILVWAHFFSDTIFGAALGCWVASQILGTRLAIATCQFSSQQAGGDGDDVPRRRRQPSTAGQARGLENGSAPNSEDAGSSRQAA